MELRKVIDRVRDVMHIWPQEPLERNGTLTLSALMEMKGKEPFRLWFSVPAQCLDALSQTCEPFVVAAIFPAMREASQLVVHGEVSTTLLRNIEEFQAVWSSWLPQRYSEVRIAVDRERQGKAKGGRKKAILAFSGGLDSCFTAYRHAKGTCGRQRKNLAAGLMVHGFDIPLADKRAFAAAQEKSRVILDSLGVALIPMATNLREIEDKWDHVHGAAVASCLMLFQNGFDCGLIASSFTYDSLHLNIPWGSNPLSDGLFSTDEFEIINDGSRFSRLEKLRQISKWPEALRHMRVCWEGKNLDRNCCACEKCIRGILACRVLGMNLPECFDQDASDRQVLSVKVPDMAILFEYWCMLQTAKDNGSPASLVKLLETCIKDNERRLVGKASLWRRARSIIAVRSRLRRLHSRYSAWLGRKPIEAGRP
jgi:hypothetical protein